MSRPIVELEIQGRKLNAILDAGAWRSHIRADLAKQLPSVSVEPFEVKLGGQSFPVKEGKLVSGGIRDTEGHAYKFGQILYPIDDLGRENGKTIDLLFGAVILEDWGTVIDESAAPPRVDYAHLRKGELTELPGLAGS